MRNSTPMYPPEETSAMTTKVANLEDDDKKETEEVVLGPNDLGPGLAPPDGGWGWMIVIAAGFSNFCMMPILQNFGLIFRDHFEAVGINSSQTTTILNVNAAVMACVGLANGPLFRKYSYRQVCFVASLLCATSICAVSFMETFYGVLIFMSVLYGAAFGIAMSAVALALNTYFKKRRRIATGFSWTCTGLGPIVMPQVIRLLIPAYGMSGTVLLFGGFSLNAVACALLLQPVSRHAKKNSEYEDIKAEVLADSIKEKAEEEKRGLKNGSGKARSVENMLRLDKLSNLVDDHPSQRFGSQYLYYDDEQEGAAGLDVLAIGTPMMSRANDGWFSKKNSSIASLASTKTLKRDSSQQPTSGRTSISLSRPPSLKALSRGNSVRNLSRQNSDADGWKRKLSSHMITAPQLIIVKESCELTENDRKHENDESQQQCHNDNVINNQLAMRSSINRKEIEEKEVKLPWYTRAFRAVSIYFDLDLLRDPVYVNLMMGMNMANFAELNFSLLTPFILYDYGLGKPEVATIMSVLGGVDVATRLTIPFIATRIGWENRTFFLIGIGTIAMGRVVLAHIGDYGILMGVAVLVGVGKALRTIFMSLVIPTHVPLERLPAATGLQLVTNGMVNLAFGPLVGWIRDVSGNFTIMLYCLNVLTFLTIISWTLEVQYRGWKQRRMERKKKAPA